MTRGLPAETWLPFAVDVTTEWPNNMGEHFFWENDAGRKLSGIRVVIAGGDLLSVRGRSPGDPRLYDVAWVDQLDGAVRRSTRQIAQTVSHEIRPYVVVLPA